MNLQDETTKQTKINETNEKTPGAFSFVSLFFVCFVVSLQLYSQAENNLRRAGALFDQRKFTEAADEAQKAIDGNPGLIGAWKLRGLSLQLAGRIPEAERLFASALQRFQQDADLWFYYARVQYLQSSLRPAERAARRALELRPDHSGAHTQLAIVLEALNDYTNALEHYRRGIEIDAKQPRPPTLPLVYAGNLLIKLDRAQEALDYFTRAAGIDPKSAELSFLRGRALEKLGRRTESEDAYQRAVSLDGHIQARAALERLRAGVALSTSKGKKDLPVS